MKLSPNILIKFLHRIRLLSEEFSKKRIVEKVLVTLPERFESKISSLEESKDLSQISLAELMNVLQAHEQRRALREEKVIEGAFRAQNQQGNKDKKEGNGGKKKYSSCRYCKKTTHLEKYCWWRLDAVFGNCKQTGHVAKVCKQKNNRQPQQVQAAELETQEEELFVATCFQSMNTNHTWLIDSGCTNHMSFNAEIFKDLDKSFRSKVKIGNGDLVDVKGKGTVEIETFAVDASLEHSERNPAEHNHPSPITSNMLASPEIGCPEGPLPDTFIIKNGKPSPDIKPKRGGVKIESHNEKDFKSKMASENESLADPKCLASLLQNDSSTILSCTQTVGNVIKELQKVGKDLVDFSTEEQILTENVRTGVGEKKNDLAYIKKTVTSEAVVYAGEAAKHPTPKHCEEEPDFLVPVNVESPILEKSKNDIYKKSNREIEDKLIVQNSHSPWMQGSQLPAQSFCSAVIANGATTDIQSSGGDAKNLPEQDLTLVEKVKKEIEEEINPAVRKEDKGSDVIVFVEAEAEAVKSTAFGMADSVPVEGAILTETSSQVFVGQQAGDEIGAPQGLEILKSIVPGGLVETITSLGIVSSAVSAGSASLNIIALGLANLVGGLFIIGHNLSELKNDQSGGDPQQMNKEEDRYREILGRREDFLLHAVVAVLSFLIFGSVIYGILIRENYNDEVKVAAVAATSLACIILLAIAKVDTKRPPKSYIKTVVHYVTLALAASGMSYIVGGLIKDLLEKFSQTEPGLVISMPISEKMEPAWRSY